MSAPRIARLTGCLFLLALAAGTNPLRADIIDVEGEGALDGTVVSQDAEVVVFRDSYGNERSIARERVTVVQRDSEAGWTSRAGKEAQKRLREGTDWIAGSRRWMEETAENPESVVLAYRRSVEGATSWARKRLSEARRAAIRQFYRDLDVERTLDDAIQDYTSRLGRFGTGRTWPVAAAVLAAGVSILLFGYAAARLVHFYFERGAWTGVAGLSLAGVPLSRWIGGLPGDALAVAPVLVNAYLLTVFWSEIRRWVVLQVFAFNGILLGYWILRAFP